MKNNFLVFVVFCIFALSATAHAYDVSFNQTSIEVNTTEVFGELLFNLSENETLDTATVFSSSFIFPLNFSLISDNKSMVSVLLPSNAIPQEYYGIISVLSNGSAYNFPFNLEVSERIGYEMDISNATIIQLGNVSLTDQTVLLNISLYNIGNTDIHFKFNILNKSDILFIQPDFVLQRFQNRTLELVATVPINHYIGNFNDTIEMEVFGNKSYYNFTYGILDLIDPEIEYFTIEDVEATMPSRVVVKANDNVAMKQVYLDVNNPSGVDYKYYLKNNGNEFVGYFKDTKELGSYQVIIHVIDTSGNEIINGTSFTVTELDAVNYSKTLEIFPSNKPSAMFFILTQKTPVNISIPLVEYRGNWSIDIVSESGTTKSVHNVNQSVVFDEIGEYTLYIIGTVAGNSSGKTSKGYMTGTIMIQPIEQHVSIENITFETTVLSYILSDPFSVSFGEVRVECTPVDKGNYIQSELMCVFHYPPDTTKDRMSVMLTQEAYGAMIKSHDVQLAIKESRIDAISSQRQMWAFLFFLSIITSMVVFYVHPRYLKV